MMEKIPCQPSLGADVEYFLHNDRTDEIEIACGKVGGTKDNPLEINHRGYFVQEDNVMVEWNIPVAHSWDAFYNAITDAVAYVNDHVRTTVGADYSAVCRAEHKFKPIDLVSPQAKTFGCEPDFDAYTGGKMRPDGARDLLGLRRTCGGHIHLGGNFNCPDFVAALFAELYFHVFATLPMDYSSVRQQWYGQPGVFRPKPYGIEYRTPDSTWTDNDHAIELVSIYGLKCSEFLTKTTADKLQRTFRQFPWLELRKYVSGETHDNRTRLRLLHKARELGIDP